MKDYPLWLNGAVLVVAAAMIWWAGTRLERYADQISRRTGLGQAFTGMLLLAVSTSLPEVATTVTAIAFLNNPTLATHNLLGGVALQTAILAAADATMRRRGALTFFSPNFALLIQGVGLLMLLQLTIAGISNIFGSNAFCVGLLLVADVLYREGTILSHAGDSLVFVAAVGAVMTCLYLWGLMERRDRTAFGVVGWDTVAACLVYVGGMAVLYFMK